MWEAYIRKSKIPKFMVDPLVIQAAVVSYALITNVIGLLSTVRLVSDVTNLDLTIPYHFIA